MAFSNRGIMVVWGVMWGVLLFGDAINFATVIAILLIIAGIALVGIGGEKERE